MVLEVLPFKREHFEEYQTWYADEQLNRELGPMDAEWLEAVLSEVPPSQFVFRDNGRTVAVAGITRPTSEHDYFVITDVAVNPKLRRGGIGTQVIDQLVRYVNQEAAWATFIDEENWIARCFFESIGWHCEQPRVAEDGMLKYNRGIRQ